MLGLQEEKKKKKSKGNEDVFGVIMNLVSVQLYLGRLFIAGLLTQSVCGQMAHKLGDEEGCRTSQQWYSVGLKSTNRASMY